jgi:hypothetical protein
MEKFASSFALHATICGTHHIQTALCAKEIQKLKEICVRRAEPGCDVHIETLEIKL